MGTIDDVGGLCGSDVKVKMQKLKKSCEKTKIVLNKFKDSNLLFKDNNHFIPYYL